MAIPYEDVYIQSFDGLKLFAKYYHDHDGAPLEILCHGYHGTAERDFCGGFWLAREAGHNILLIDERAHGKSDGHVITFGVKERRDVLSWIEYSIGRFGRDIDIFLVGVSMGASTVLMTAEFVLPKQVKGIIADCGYTTPGEIIRNTAANMGLPADILYPFARFGARVLGRFDPEAASAKTAMTKCRIPVLIIHGEDDRFVPCYMGVENYEACACPDKTLLIIPGAGHTLSYMVDPEKYREATLMFLRDHTPSF